MGFLLFNLKQVNDQIMAKVENNDIFKFLNIGMSLYKTCISKKFENKPKYQPPDHRKILSFIPGTVMDIMVKEGQSVEKGDDLMILDAMKMQNRLKSAITGRIKKIHANKGDRVSKGTLLLELE